jgi:tRNA A-37 threonylcarbamoyl transferase component Bud32
MSHTQTGVSTRKPGIFKRLRCLFSGAAKQSSAQQLPRARETMLPPQLDKSQLQIIEAPTTNPADYCLELNPGDTVEARNQSGSVAELTIAYRVYTSQEERLNTYMAVDGQGRQYYLKQPALNSRSISQNTEVIHQFLEELNNTQNSPYFIAQDNNNPPRFAITQVSGNNFVQIHDGNIDLDAFQQEINTGDSLELLSNSGIKNFTVIGRVACSEGAMSNIFLVIDEENNQYYLKQPVIPDQFPPQRKTEVIRRFRNEVEAMERLETNNVPEFIARDNNIFPRYVVMEQVNGENLGSIIKNQDRNLSAQDKINIITNVLHALSNLVETMGFDAVHRDLKPENIIIEMDTGKVILIDFGTVKNTNNSRITLDGPEGFVGTPEYAPPEGMRYGSHAVFQCGDIYSMGIILYELMTGRKPYNFEDDPGQPEGTKLWAFAMDPQSTIAAFHACRPATVPLAIWQVICKATQFDPNERYQTFKEFSSAVINAAVQTGISVAA